MRVRLIDYHLQKNLAGSMGGMAEGEEERRKVAARGVWKIVLPLCACWIACVGGEVQVSWLISGEEFARISSSPQGKYLSSKRRRPKEEGYVYVNVRGTHVSVY